MSFIQDEDELQDFEFDLLELFGDSFHDQPPALLTEVPAGSSRRCTHANTTDYLDSYELEDRLLEEGAPGHSIFRFGTERGAIAPIPDAFGWWLPIVGL